MHYKDENHTVMNDKKIFHSMKVIYEKAIEVNNDHELNIDEQQDDIN